MPLFVIDKIPVSLTWDKDRQLREEIYGEGGVVGSYIKVYGQKNKTHKLQKKVLHKKYRENRAAFIEEYSMFDLHGEDASVNLWDLVYDYCVYYGCGYPSDARDQIEIIKDDYAGDNYFYPQGKVFYLNQYAAPYNWNWKYIKRKKGRIIRTVIDTRNVERVVGTIANFSIMYKDRIIKCGEIFEEVPIK